MEPHARPRVSVRFGAAGRTQTFLLAEPLEPRLRIGESIVIQTPDGPSIGQVHPHPEALETRRRPAAAPDVPVRRVTAADLAERFARPARARSARAMDRIRAHKLAMKLSRVEATPRRLATDLLFTADERIDFRELVKGWPPGSGRASRCGRSAFVTSAPARRLRLVRRPLCCTTWLTSFEPVSIRMAKQQDLALNPSKLSGLCGRLKCCLRYELPNAKGVVRGGCGDEGGVEPDRVRHGRRLWHRGAARARDGI